MISRISAQSGAVSWSHNLIYGAPNIDNIIAKSWLGSASSFVFIGGYFTNTSFLRIEINKNGAFTKSESYRDPSKPAWVVLDIYI